jgi:hypothetical protein
MTELVHLISTYGVETVLVAVLLFILLGSEFQLHYPRSRKKPPR